MFKDNLSRAYPKIFLIMNIVLWPLTIFLSSPTVFEKMTYFVESSKLPLWTVFIPYAVIYGGFAINIVSVVVIWRKGGQGRAVVISSILALASLLYGYLLFALFSTLTTA